MKTGFDATSIALCLALSALLIVLAATGSSGLYNIDEALYLTGAETFHSTRSFEIQNRFDGLSSPDLRLWYLVEGPLGLVPQYPVGVTLAAQPLIGPLGPKALLALNVITGIGTLFATHALSRRLFANTQAANLAVALLFFSTFWVEYVTGYWPHSTSVFLVSLAVLTFLSTLDREKGAWVPAFLTGLLIGLGMFFRLEAALLLPAIAAITLIYSRDPLAIFAGGAAGLGVMLALMSYANLIRFGTPNPLTYGRSGGVTDASSFLILGLILLAGLLLLAAMRRLDLQKQRSLGVLIIAIAGAGLLALALTTDAAKPFFRGILAIMVDARTHESDIPGAMQSRPDGTVLFWGLPKKALGQSLPWLGGLAALVFMPFGENRKPILIVLIFAAVWSLPFVAQSWHGGLSSNPRLFLPILPLLAVLNAWIVLVLLRQITGPARYLPLATALVGLLVPWLWVLTQPDVAFSLHQIWSVPVLLGILVCALIAGLHLRGITASLALAALGFGIGFASFLAKQDYQMTHDRRAQMGVFSQAVATIPGPVLFYGPPEIFHPALAKPDQRLALPDQHSFALDYALLLKACAANYRIILDQFMARPLFQHEGWTSAYSWPDAVTGPAVSEVNCARFVDDNM